MSNQLKWWGWGIINKTLDVMNMPSFWDFAEKNVGIDRQILLHPPFTFEEIELSQGKPNHDFISALSTHLKAEQISSDKLVRLQHCYGKSYADLWRVRSSKFHLAPDYVIFPESTKDVEMIMQLANAYHILIIPFGGGTNIVGATEVRPNYVSKTIACLDLKRMNRLLSIDEKSMTATFEAGVIGPALEETLKQHGFEFGHFPDSFEFSTLGGWAATRSVGMQSDRYGAIDDMILGVTCVTAEGTIVTKAFPHSSAGPDLKHIFIGSEGAFGIITELVVKIHHLPDKRLFRGILFPSFAEGIDAIYACVKNHCSPHTMRLSDNRETQLSMSLKKPKHAFAHFLEKIFKWYLRVFKRFDFENCCVMIISTAGPAALYEQRKVLAICKKYRGIDLGQDPGNQWYARKYDYPYLRDLVMDYGCTVDVVETSTVWSNILPLYQNVQNAIYQAMQHYNDKDHTQKIMQTSNYPGYLGCHISHIYHNGVCLYFTFATLQNRENELEHYYAIKKIAIDAVVKSGGTLSHHHSVGYEHLAWLRQEISPIGMNMITGIKKTLDPQQLCNPNALNDKESK